MVRFKVVKASHLLLIAAAVLLLAVLLVILLNGAGDGKMAGETAGAADARARATAEALSAAALSIQVKADTIAASVDVEAPSVLIYSTHSHEAYAQDSTDPYPALEAWRTEDEAHSVVRVAAALAQALRDLGINVIHDQTDHEQGDLNSAYLRSLETLENYQQTFDLTIDIHRDAYTSGLKRFVSDDADNEYAQLMFLIGRGDAYDAAEKPNYSGNLAFAQRVTGTINRKFPDLCRNVLVKTGRYNQHIGRTGVLIEVGHNLNNLQQALNSIPALAVAIDEALLIHD